MPEVRVCSNLFLFGNLQVSSCSPLGKNHSQEAAHNVGPTMLVLSLFSFLLTRNLVILSNLMHVWPSFPRGVWQTYQITSRVWASPYFDITAFTIIIQVRARAGCSNKSHTLVLWACSQGRWCHGITFSSRLESYGSKFHCVHLLSKKTMRLLIDVRITARNLSMQCLLAVASCAHSKLGLLSHLI